VGERGRARLRRRSVPERERALASERRSGAGLLARASSSFTRGRAPPPHASAAQASSAPSQTWRGELRPGPGHGEPPSLHPRLGWEQRAALPWTGRREPPLRLLSERRPSGLLSSASEVAAGWRVRSRLPCSGAGPLSPRGGCDVVPRQAYRAVRTSAIDAGWRGQHYFGVGFTVAQCNNFYAIFVPEYEIEYPVRCR
jgi:hypothetical protein